MSILRRPETSGTNYLAPRRHVQNNGDHVLENLSEDTPRTSGHYCSSGSRHKSAFILADCESSCAHKCRPQILDPSSIAPHFFFTFICLRATSLSYDVAHRTIRSWRQNSFGCFSRWPWNTLRNGMCGGACCRKEWGGEAFSSIFTTDTRSWSIPDWGVIL
jgi:hypothetical protein